MADLPLETWHEVIGTNLTGVFYCCRAAVPWMRKRGGGYIINLGSLAGVNPIPNLSAYSASKFGLNGFSEAFMQEIRYDGIKVSTILPGSVDTEFGGRSPGRESWRLAPTDIADVVLHLLAHDPRSLPSRVEIRPCQPAPEPGRGRTCARRRDGRVPASAYRGALPSCAVEGSPRNPTPNAGLISFREHPATRPR